LQFFLGAQETLEKAQNSPERHWFWARFGQQSWIEFVGEKARALMLPTDNASLDVWIRRNFCIAWFGPISSQEGGVTMKNNTPKDSQDTELVREIGEAFMTMTLQRKPPEASQVLLPREVLAHRRHLREGETSKHVCLTDQRHFSEQPSQKEK